MSRRACRQWYSNLAEENRYEANGTIPITLLFSSIAMCDRNGIMHYRNLMLEREWPWTDMTHAPQAKLLDIPAINGGHGGILSTGM